MLEENKTIEGIQCHSRCFNNKRLFLLKITRWQSTQRMTRIFLLLIPNELNKNCRNKKKTRVHCLKLKAPLIFPNILGKILVAQNSNYEGCFRGCGNLKKIFDQACFISFDPMHSNQADMGFKWFILTLVVGLCTLWGGVLSII